MLFSYTLEVVVALEVGITANLRFEKPVNAMGTLTITIHLRREEIPICSTSVKGREISFGQLFSLTEELRGHKLSSETIMKLFEALRAMEIYQFPTSPFHIQDGEPCTKCHGSGSTRRGQEGRGFDYTCDRCSGRGAEPASSAN